MTEGGIGREHDDWWRGLKYEHIASVSQNFGFSEKVMLCDEDSFVVCASLTLVFASVTFVCVHA